MQDRYILQLGRFINIIIIKYKSKSSEAFSSVVALSCICILSNKFETLSNSKIFATTYFKTD